MKGLVIEILNTSGKWLINGKQYNECTEIEKDFFNDFIKHMNYGDLERIC